MKYVDASPSDAFEAVILLEALEPETLGFITLPRCVWYGIGHNPNENVNFQYCEANSIPAVRSIVKGRAVSYQGDDNLWLIFSTEKPMNNEVVKRILLDAFTGLGLDVVIKDRGHDVKIGKSRIAMFGGSQRTPARTHITPVELCLGADFDKIKKTLKYPPDKWRDKEVNRIEDWLLPLKHLLGPSVREQVIEAIIAQVENHLGVELKRRNISESEISNVADLMERYLSESWISRGKWSPIKDYGGLSHA